MHGDTNRARLVGDGPGDRLANPPGSICREFVATAVFKFLNCFH